MAPPAKKVKGPSAYMMFSEEHRPHVQARLRAEAADGKVPITVIAKALGELWKSLTEEKQQEYRHKAHQRAADAAAAAEGQHLLILLSHQYLSFMSGNKASESAPPLWKQRNT